MVKEKQEIGEAREKTIKRCHKHCCLQTHIKGWFFCCSPCMFFFFSVQVYKTQICFGLFFCCFLGSVMYLINKSDQKKETLIQLLYCCKIYWLYNLMFTVHNQCPHDGKCPLENTSKYCHFVQRLERTSSQRVYKVCFSSSIFVLPYKILYFTILLTTF